MAFTEFREALIRKPVKGENEAVLIHTPEHSSLLHKVAALVNTSRADMSTYYDRWDRHDYTFRAFRRPDRDDFRMASKGQQRKIIVPLTFSQVMTFVSFSILTLMQNRRFFEFEPVPGEANPLEEPLELIVERDLRRNQWLTFLVQFFLDIGRFSVGCAEIGWLEEFRNVRIPQTQNVEGAFGVNTKVETNEFMPLRVFGGNKVFPVSPYRFFPDTRMPLSRYQDGEFCASEDVWSYSALQSQAQSLNLFNLDFIPKYTEAGYRRRREISRVNLGGLTMRENPNLGTGTSDVLYDNKNNVKSGQVVVTKGVYDIIPKYFRIDQGEMELGDETFPIRYIIWYANDQTIIRFEEAQYLHGMFPYVCAQYIPDQHHDINEGLSDICDEITHFVTWKMNAHIASVRNSVQSKYIIDPTMVDVKDIETKHSPYIFTKKNAALSGVGVDKFMTQFITQDVTANTMKDIEALNNLLEKVTGLSAMMQGQHSSGRRSATQDRVVAQGAAARGKTTLGCIWDMAFDPLGKQLIVNNRQEMDFTEFTSIIGQRHPTGLINPDTQQPFTAQELFVLFKADPQTLARQEQFFVFDGTLPSEKAFLAQSMQEIFVTLMSNPQVAAVLGFDAATMREIFNQIYLLRGVTPARLPKPTQAPAPGAPGQPNVVPMQPPAAAAGTV